MRHTEQRVEADEAAVLEVEDKIKLSSMNWFGISSYSYCNLCFDAVSNSYTFIKGLISISINWWIKMFEYLWKNYQILRNM